MKLRYALMIAALLCLTSPAFADLVLSGTAGAGFMANTGPTNAGLMYWDNPSDDSPSLKCNIGYILNGSSTGCSSQIGPNFQTDDPTGNFPFWGQPGGINPRPATKLPGNGQGATTEGYDPNFHFTHGGSGYFDDSELEIKITGWSGSAFGYYTYVNGIDPSGGIVTTQLFGASSVPEKATAVIPAIADPFGFYFATNAGTFYTDSALNAAIGGLDVGVQHFAVFRVLPPGNPANNVATKYYVGMEDNVGVANHGASPGDYDYNDYIVEVTTVPEPASVLLFGTVVLGVVTLTRRFRKA